MSKAKGEKTGKDGTKLVAKNKKAYFNYQVVEDLEVGLVLTGTEVKSLREGKLQLMDAYAMIERGEVWLVHAHIGEYGHGSYYNHVPLRPRKLLLHRKEIEKLGRKVEEKGFTLIPLEVYFREGRAKVKLGLCRGKASHDKRDSIKERDVRRESSRELSER